MKHPAVLVTPGALTPGSVVALDAAELHHLRVRRVAPGAMVICLDGNGNVGEGTLLADAMSVAIGDVRATPEGPRTILAVGAGDKDRFIALAERCTELGVWRLIPLDTERARAVETRVRPATIARAQLRAREACKQSGNPRAARVDDLASLDTLANWSGFAWHLGASNGGVVPAVVSDHAGWIIGPEGGLTQGEIDYCTRDLGAQPVCLGRSIMRFDTAATAAAVLTNHRRPSGELA